MPELMACLYIAYVYVNILWASVYTSLSHVETCVLKPCVGFGMCRAASWELKVLDKTKWIWQARLIRQRFGDLFQTRRKRKKHRRTFLLPPRRLLIMSLSPPIKLSMFTSLGQREEITGRLKTVLKQSISIWNDDPLLAVSKRVWKSVN